MGLFGKGFNMIREPERIKGAVIRYKGVNFVGAGHAEAHDKMIAEFPEMRLTPEKEEARGWLTSRGRIVQTEEAYEIKLKSGQIAPGTPPPHLNE